MIIMIRNEGVGCLRGAGARGPYRAHRRQRVAELAADGE
jgi:hypothetical protein